MVQVFIAPGASRGPLLTASRFLPETAAGFRKERFSVIGGVIRSLGSREGEFEGERAGRGGGNFDLQAGGWLSPPLMDLFHEHVDLKAPDRRRKP